MSCPKIQATNEHSDLSLSLKEMTHVSYIKYAPQRLWFVLMWFRHVNQDPNCCVSSPSIAEVWWTICLWTSQRTIHQYISFHRLSVHMNPGFYKNPDFVTSNVLKSLKLHDVILYLVCPRISWPFVMVTLRVSTQPLWQPSCLSWLIRFLSNEQTQEFKYMAA